MSRLFIIGNGFDLYNGLKTRYSDFHSFISKNCNDLENDIENYFSFKVDEHSAFVGVFTNENMIAIHARIVAG